MAIVDYLRQTRPSEEDGRHHLVIPSFHAGGLGFLPGIDVSATLLTQRGGYDRACELEISAFPGQMGHRFECEITLDDEPGLIHRVFDAIAALNVNCVDQSSNLQVLESGQILLHLELLLDWHTNPSLQRRIDSHPVELERYDYLREHIPVTDARYIRLYEAIMSTCADRVRIENRYGYLSPAIRMVPFSYRNTTPVSRTVEVERRLENGFYSQIRISDDFVERIKSTTSPQGADTDPKAPIPYILSSDPSSRTLRAMFPRTKSSRRLFRIGLKHFDEVAGPIATFSYGLGQMEANIVGSLLRKYNHHESIWEIAFEFLGDERDLPDADADADALLRWFSDLFIRKNSKSVVDAVARYRTRVSEPEYPRRSSDTSIEIGQRDLRAEAASVPNAYPAIASALTPIIQAPREGPREASRRRFAEDVSANLQRKRPAVFLSYSASGKQIADEIRQAVSMSSGALVDFHDFQIKNNSDKELGSIKAIQRCDYLISIWTPNPESDVVSPWIVSEWFWARQTDRPTLVIEPDGLPYDASARRIDDNQLHLSFRPGAFMTDAMPQVKQNLEAFAEIWRSSTPRLASQT